MLLAAQFGELLKMSPITQEVLASAQALPTAAQVELIEALIAGLDEVDPEPLDEASIAEIQRRSAEYDTGLVRPVAWSEVLNPAHGRQIRERISRHLGT